MGLTRGPAVHLERIGRPLYRTRVGAYREALKRTGRKRCRQNEVSMIENHVPNVEQALLPHLDAAYNLARWLTRNEQDAQDVTQEAFMRAFRFFDGYQGGNMRAWLLTIVRNTCY